MEKAILLKPKVKELGKMVGSGLLTIIKHCEWASGAKKKEF